MDESQVRKAALLLATSRHAATDDDPICTESFVDGWKEGELFGSQRRQRTALIGVLMVLSVVSGVLGTVIGHGLGWWS